MCGHTLHSLWALVDCESEVIQQCRHANFAGRDVSGVQYFAGHNCMGGREEAAGKCCRPWIKQYICFGVNMQRVDCQARYYSKQ